jgi:glutamate racemase
MLGCTHYPLVADEIAEAFAYWRGHAEVFLYSFFKEKLTLQHQVWFANQKSYLVSLVDC